jgi:transcription termination factor Rho
VDFVELEPKTLGELREIARSMEISGYSRLKKEDLILRLLRAQAEQQGYIFGGGVLDIVEEGIGFLRADHYLPGPNDVYVSQSQIRRFGLRTGDMIVGQVRPPKENEKYFGLLRVDAVNGLDPEQAKARALFENLTPIFPDDRFILETDPHNLSMRLLDMVAPIGRGQRGLIVSPPKAGKTTVLKNIANAISKRYTEVHLMVVLIGERPEEVTDMDRSVDAEVISSTFDEPVQNHVRVAETALARAKRLVEGRRRGHFARFHHPSGPGLQPDSSPFGAHPVGRPRPGCALPSQALFWRSAQHRGRRQPDHYSHLPGRHRLAHG